MSEDKHYIGDYLVTVPSGRRNLITSAEGDGKSTVRTDYPHAIVQGEELKQVAERFFTNWSEGALKDAERTIKVRAEERYSQPSPFIKGYIEEWKANISEAKRVYVAAFIGGYTEQIAEEVKKDTKYGGKPRLTINTTGGASIKIVSIDRSADRYTYTIEISDPGYLTHPVVFIAPIPKG